MTTPGIPKDFWNARFGEQGFAYGERASRLLLAFRDLLKPGQRALVPACGEGRDAVFLAECGQGQGAQKQAQCGFSHCSLTLQFVWFGCDARS